MVKHTQTIRQQQVTNCLSVFDHFVGLALKGLTGFSRYLSLGVKYLQILFTRIVTAITNLSLTIITGSFFIAFLSLLINGGA